MQQVQKTNNTIYPSNYISVSGGTAGTGTSYQASNFLDSVESENSARFTLTKNNSTKIIYGINCDVIPASAIINSVSCIVKCYVSSVQSGYVNTAVCAIYSENIIKSSEVSFRSTSKDNIITINANNLSRADLNNLQLQFDTTNGAGSTWSTLYAYLYGATFTINYTVNCYRYTMTIYNGTNISEVPAESDEIVEDTDVVLEILPTFPSIFKWLKINGTKVSVQDNKYTKQNVTADFIAECMCSVTPKINVDGSDRTGIAVYKKINKQWVAQNEENWPDILIIGEKLNKKRFIKGW